MDEQIEIRIHGDAALPTLIHLPGLHGDWTLIASFRGAVASKVRFVEFTYPRTTTWSLNDYADAVLEKLIESQITRGWLLGESFGSQIIWPLLAKFGFAPVTTRPARSFEPEGVILAGGFVRHPCPSAAKLAQLLLEKLPSSAIRAFFVAYAVCARVRFRRAAESLASLQEFISRRTPQDIAAMAHRLRLIHSNDPRAIASKLSIPVYQIAGGLDPIVPAAPVRRWLAANCPAYRGRKLIWLADHNVLSTAPKAAADQVQEWMRRT